MTKTICSVYFRPCVTTRPFKKMDGSTGFNCEFNMPAASREGHSILKVEDMFQWVYLVEGNYSEVPVLATDIANDLVQEWAGNMPSADGSAGPGIAVIAGTEPTKEEITRLRNRQILWCERLRLEALDFWTKDRKLDVGSIHKDASLWLGHNEDPWLAEPKQINTRPCPLCGSKIEGDVVVCPHCHNVVDIQRWNEYQNKLKATVSPTTPGPVTPPVAVRK